MSDQSVRAEPSAIPAEIDRWNWGAFLLNGLWGIANNTPVALLTFLPLVGFVMPFVLGAKGSAWAWRNRHWDSVEQFKRVQRSWAIMGAVFWIAMIALLASLFSGLFFLLDHSEAYRLSISRLKASAEAADALGTPISTSPPLGSISFNGTSGRAVLTFSASGPKAAGRVFVEAFKTGGVWSLKTLVLRVEGTGRVINLLRPSIAELERSPLARRLPAAVSVQIEGPHHSAVVAGLIIEVAGARPATSPRTRFRRPGTALTG